MNNTDKIKINIQSPSPYDRININSLTVIGCKFENNNLIEEELEKYVFNKSQEKHELSGLLNGTIYNVSTEYSEGNEKTNNDTYLSYCNIVDFENSIFFNEQYIKDKDRRHQYLYYYIKINYLPYLSGEEIIENGANKELINQIVFANSSRNCVLSIIKSLKYKDGDEEPYNSGKYSDDYNNALISSIYVHGRSVNADEINYFDLDKNNQCLPTK